MNSLLRCLLLFQIMWFYYRNEDDVFFITHINVPMLILSVNKRCNASEPPPRFSVFIVLVYVYTFSQLPRCQGNKRSRGRNMVNNKYFIRRYCSTRHGCSINLYICDDMMLCWRLWHVVWERNKPATIYVTGG